MKRDIAELQSKLRRATAEKDGATKDVKSWNQDKQALIDEKRQLENTIRQLQQTCV